ncbi:putative ATPase/DNA-binding NarL/FixJ family response regulator [Streptosporangium becharense]|uniref:Putative ATPase/DNA-binding NarL/FixJ family response regulator n=1 Tax=Streptosporangium becharense TaxID=1816182 RepID=A0A7W9MIF8_9ACTN|nr:tetratricopeptide repeat protein [Streptosporangium becharense]MBB2911381.1 putative ATPase/DNA-binding NarL/FixJ family response regulator [Streptosporangium becharense]MBB5821561.1 putative ATPase/DNA-binding NarL/FixJ family response regulator [Streptosporangium becharense]
MTQDIAHDPRTGGNLPLEPNEFVGREADVEELTDLLAVARLVTLCGAGGIGKSRLAVRVAARVAREFPGGVWLVELADAVRGDPVEPRVAAVLGVKAEPSRALTETLLGVLGDRRLLLVIDNCESLIEESARFCRAVLTVCPQVRVLTTSREPLRVAGETVWRVPPLTLPRGGGHDLTASEAVRLFVDRARAASRGFAVTDQNATDIADLCEALDGMPLAIELAAALCRVLTVEQINARIRDRFRLLSAGDRTAPARQRTLRATVDWSYQQLDEPERVLLRRLAVFTGGWTLDMAEQVCPGDALRAEDVLGVLCDLVDKSLVLADAEVAGQTRYRMLETIREYAAEQLAASGEEPGFRLRHRDHMIEVAARIHRTIVRRPRPAWTEIRPMLVMLDELQANVWAAVRFSAEVGEVESALRLLVLLRWPIIAGGRFTPADEWLDRLLTAAPDELTPSVRADALALRGQVAFGQGDPDSARAACTTAVELCREAGLNGPLSGALAVLAWVAIYQRRPERARSLLDQALEAVHTVDDPWHETVIRSMEGTFALSEGRAKESQRSFEAALAIAHELDNHWAAPVALIGLAQVAWLRGDLAEARTHYERALDMLQDITAHWQAITCLSGLGRIALAQGDLVTARARLVESLRLCLGTGQRLGVARRIETLAQLALAEEDDRRAVRLAGAATAIRSAMGGAVLPPGFGARMEELLQPARMRLGDALVAQLWAHGQEMSREQAVRYALQSGESCEPPVLPGGHPAVAPTTTLTCREWEIAQLVARGMSNKAIADELVISPATAARHVANILAKLGFSSRTQVATWVIERNRA